MKFILRISAVICVMVSLSNAIYAELLPSMYDKPWRGFFSGYERRNFQFGINNEGECMLYLMKSRKERAALQKTVKIYTELYVEDQNGKRSYKRLKKGGSFSTVIKPGVEHPEVSYLAEMTGDAKVRVTIKYDGNRVIMDGRVLSRGELDKGRLYFCFKVMMPGFYYTATYGDDSAKAKEKMRKDDFKYVCAVDDKKKSLDVWKQYDLGSDELTGGGVRWLKVDMSAQEGRKFVFTTSDGRGAFELENRHRGKKSEPWRGYYVRWSRPMKEEKGKEMSPFVIEVK